MKKILVVEDDKYLLEAYKAKLTKSGFEIKTAMDGEEALTAVADFNPDLILLDILMPKKDGFAVLKDLKQHETWKKIPVIISSNLSQNDDVYKGMDLGATDFFVKADIPINEVVAKINNLLSQ